MPDGPKLQIIFMNLSVNLSLNYLSRVRYQSEKFFCEMVQSQEYRKLVNLKKDGLQDSYTSMTSTIMAYQKDLIEN
jgi:hypothetical protein